MHPYFKTNLRKFKLTFKILHVIVIPGKYKDWSKSNACFFFNYRFNSRQVYQQ